MIKDFDKDVAQILAMGEDDVTHINWSEEGGGAVHREGNRFSLYEIPKYGGIGVLDSIHGIDGVEDLVNIAYRWA